MGNSLGLPLQRQPTKEKPTRDPTIVVTAMPTESDADSDLENKEVEIKTPEEPSPNVSQWETPEVSAAQLKSQHIMSLIDPRSPCEDISRTPIMVTDGKEKRGKKRTNRPLNLSQGMNKLVTGTEPGEEFVTPTGPSSAIPSGFIDPRSPTNDIDRTPIRAFRAMSLRDNSDN